MTREFLLVFIPLFVAVDAVGILPLYLGLVEHIDGARRRRIIVQSVLTAITVAVAFVVAGQPLLHLLGLTPGDFMVAGGALLFVISLRDLMAVGKPRHTIDPETVGAVPIGVPLITGPAVLTTCLLLAEQHRMAMTVIAVVANILIAGVVFWYASSISRRLGSAGTRTLSKIASLLLACIAVMMMRKGVVALVVQVRAAGL